MSAECDPTWHVEPRILLIGKMNACPCMKGTSLNSVSVF